LSFKNPLDKLKIYGIIKKLKQETDLLQYTRAVMEKHCDLEWKLRKDGLNEKEWETYQIYEQIKKHEERGAIWLRERMY
jgi:hypothetical protein